MKGKRKLIITVVLCAFAVGCARVPGGQDAAIQDDLRGQLIVLERQIQEKDASIQEMQAHLDREKMSVSFEQQGQVARPSVRQIQEALVLAGFEPGAADGLMGERTRAAVRAFQEQSGLAVTGKVDRQTWLKLQAFSN